MSIGLASNAIAAGSLECHCHYMLIVLIKKESQLKSSLCTCLQIFFGFLEIP